MNLKNTVAKTLSKTQNLLSKSNLKLQDKICRKFNLKHNSAEIIENQKIYVKENVIDTLNNYLNKDLVMNAKELLRNKSTSELHSKLVAYFLRRNQPSQALEYLDELAKFRNVNIKDLHKIVSFYFAKNDFVTGNEIIKNMNARYALIPSSETFNLLVNSFLLQSMYDEAKALGARLMQKGWPLENYLTCFLDYYVATGRDADFRKLAAFYKEDLKNVSFDGLLNVLLKYHTIGMS